MKELLKRVLPALGVMASLKYATASDYSILMWWYSGVMRVMENRYRQVKLGIVDRTALMQLGGASGAYRHPFFRVYWESQRATFPPDFIEWRRFHRQ